MFDLDLWREIFQSISKNKLRSVLTGFTVTFAILLFTILFGIANGLNNTFKEAFVDDAANSIFLLSGKTSKAYKGLQAGRRIQFKNEDFDYVGESYDSKIEFLSARVYKSFQASYKNERSAYSVRGVHPDHQFLEKTKIKDGRYLNQRDMQEETKVAVIGRLVEKDLFLKESALGKFINLSGVQYKVVGVFTDDGGDNEERLIYLPITTAQKIYGNNDYIDQINLTYNPEMNYDQAIAFGNDIIRDLQKRFSINPTDQNAIRVRNYANGSKGIDQMNTVLGIIIILIGMGTLIAGIVGVSNIMIFIVKERTKEIGIRKALGAAPKAIVRIILLESILITTLAGYFGLLLGVGALELIGTSLEDFFIKDPGVSQSLVISATIVLILAGALAGYVPAKRAAHIKPIVALRDE
ncbi:MAG: ABC transporter permease [Bacteroidetes bacterium]|nr:ABC transporter permease [Bacteroidota bacterium]MDA0880233.1 ABC transporter permease [Bacteroidota bacterium]MDA1115355.1 ABC transporter permease [Bacteroidota bacterium]